jgi:sialic acid synthase SpsE
MSKEGVYLCADIGVNWEGHMETLLSMVREASEAKFDAVKLQWFDREYLEEAGYSPDLRNKLSWMCLSKEQVEVIAGLAHKFGLELVVTPFSMRQVTAIPDCVDGIKIRAADCFRTRMIRGAQGYGKPVYVSQPVEGGLFKKPDDVPEDTFFEVMSCLMSPNTYGVMCVPKYPPADAELHLSRVVDFLGYSSHYPLSSVPLMAATLAVNAVERGKRKRRFYLEVHMVPMHIDEDDDRYPDNAVSLTPPQMSFLARSVAILEEGI